MPVRAIAALILILLPIGPAAADDRKQPGIVIQSARWGDVQHTLTVTGYNAGRNAQVQIRYAIDDSPIGRTYADDTGQWHFKMHRLQIPPCRVQVTNGTSSADMPVRDAPTVCRTLAVLEESSPTMTSLWGAVRDEPHQSASLATSPETMPEYRRIRVPGATFFFTVNCARHEENRMLVDPIDLLRTTVRKVKDEHPFRIDAMVVLPEHLHHWNTVKHGWVQRVADWPYSSFHGSVRRGVLPDDWARVDEKAIKAGE